MDTFLNSDYIRWLLAAISMIVVVLLTMGTIARWKVMPRRFRRIVPWIIANYAVLAYALVEVAASDMDLPPGIRFALLGVTLTGLTMSLLVGMTDEDYRNH